MREDLLDYLNNNYYSHLANLDRPSRRFLILLSGIPGSGKTALAKDLERRLGAVRITKDEIRTLIYQHENIESTKEVEDQIDEYMAILKNRLLKEKNGLIIFDFGNERSYRVSRKWAKTNSYSIFIVALETNRETAEERIKEDRDEQTANWFLEQMDRWLADFEIFRQIVGYDFVIENNDENQEIKLFREIDLALEKPNS